MNCTRPILTEVHLVQIGLENLVLAVVDLQQNGH